MYKVGLKHIKGYSFSVKSAGYEFTVDAEGKEGVTPPDALLASLASCIGVYINKYSQGAHLGLSNFEITAEAEFSKESPVCFKEIYITIDLKGFRLEERRVKALAEFIKNCPVHNTLEAKPEIKIKISDGDKSKAEE